MTDREFLQESVRDSLKPIFDQVFEIEEESKRTLAAAHAHVVLSVCGGIMGGVANAMDSGLLTKEQVWELVEEAINEIGA